MNGLKQIQRFRTRFGEPIKTATIERNITTAAVKVPKQKCVGGPHNLSDEQLSKWKRQLLENAETPLFEPADKQSDASAERIAELEQLVGRLTLALDIEKKASTYLS